ncbi:hypothetical protein ABIB73_007449 [Bradyrhizobium sp. F1.4.3]
MRPKKGHFRPHKEPLPMSHRVIADYSARLICERPLFVNVAGPRSSDEYRGVGGVFNLEVATRRISAYIPHWEISDP